MVSRGVLLQPVQPRHLLSETLQFRTVHQPAEPSGRLGLVQVGAHGLAPLTGLCRRAPLRLAVICRSASSRRSRSASARCDRAGWIASHACVAARSRCSASLHASTAVAAPRVSSCSCSASARARWPAATRSTATRVGVVVEAAQLLVQASEL